MITETVLLIRIGPSLEILINLVRLSYFYYATHRLKVLGNEKGAGSGGLLQFEDGFRPW